MAQAVTSNYAAAEHVLNDVDELLEHIIFMIPTNRILTSAQRVSKHWRNIIKASPKIQQKLFFRAGNSTNVINPRLDTNPSPENELIYDQHLETNAVLNKLLSHVSTRLPTTLKSGFKGESVSCIIFEWKKQGPSELQKRRVRGFGHPKALWKSMFVTNPPCSVLNMHFIISTKNMCYQGDVWIRDPEGIRFGLVCEIKDTVRKNVIDFIDERDGVVAENIVFEVEFNSIKP